ncbi:F0F1 ATP synthase subunit gamma [Acetobacter fallax]|uniref:ATPase n=1 Tax=Acetobacter fallax TaxID=1737473 RepID=A0ABX0K8D3_9PROT|nr:FoF1 ATP synthase subunit gamma [Acetobacter fallax]NHO31458.1 ATPase [Acetobacter fallax]NHO34958.1 ATPase [Acetobacter fallax]
MTERLQDVTARIDNTRQLGGIVNSMRALAAVRVQQARKALPAVEAYSDTVRQALLRVIALQPDTERSPDGNGQGKAGLILFCAEQGFAGLFSEHMLDAVQDSEKGGIFLIGTRGAAIARSREVSPVWTAAAAQHPAAIPDLAATIANEICRKVLAGELSTVATVFCHWHPGQGAVIVREMLFPLDPALLKAASAGPPPLLNLPPEKLMTDLTADYLFSRLCQAALHSFAAENEARSERMTAAHQEIERRLQDLEQRRRMVRQDDITSEIIELVSGPTLARLKRFSGGAGE